MIMHIIGYYKSNSRHQQNRYNDANRFRYSFFLGGFCVFFAFHFHTSANH